MTSCTNSMTGLCAWPTAFGAMHAKLGGRDVVAELVDLLHARGIAACAYYTVNFNNWAYHQHPAAATSNHPHRTTHPPNGCSSPCSEACWTARPPSTRTPTPCVWVVAFHEPDHHRIRVNLPFHHSDDGRLLAEITTCTPSLCFPPNTPGLPRKLTSEREGNAVAAQARTNHPATARATGARRPLNRQRVLDTALAYVDQHGLAALTMRRLGTELGVEGMSLYKHVADKEALLDGIVERLWAEVPAPSSPRVGWRRALRELAWGLLELFRRHPTSAPLLVLREFVNLQSLRCYDAYLTALQRTGFNRRSGIDAIGTVVGHALGYALLELRYLGPHPETTEASSDIQQIRRITHTLPADTPDSLIALAIDLTSECDRDRCFTITLKALLDGLTPTPSP